MAPDTNRANPSSPGPKLVPASEHFEPPGQGAPPELTPVIQNFPSLGALEGANRTEKALVLAGVRLLRLWHGEGRVQGLQEILPQISSRACSSSRVVKVAPQPVPTGHFSHIVLAISANQSKGHADIPNQGGRHVFRSDPAYRLLWF